MKVYITKSNAKRILRKIRLSDIGDIEGTVYKKPIYFLSKWEKKTSFTYAVSIERARKICDRSL
jgi:hypothetical protein